MIKTIGRDLKNQKQDLLDYYRSRSAELISELRSIYGDSEFKERAAAANKGLIEARGKLLKIIAQNSKSENWSCRDVLEAILMATYTNYVVMIETRNELWPYEYMTFARRIGELWEPFCQLCWECPINQNLKFFIPPLFKDVKRKLTNEIESYIDSLNIAKQEKGELKKYYHKVWTLVTSGEIKLELDLHFEDAVNKYAVDFKSGFSSNEKGNTNRLLLVASVYSILEEGYKCLLFVRSSEESNNHYLQTLKKSGLWSVYCGMETYGQIKAFTGFDLAGWLKKNMDWKADMSDQAYKHLKNNNLVQYLKW
jgi:hypothetical protein